MNTNLLRSEDHPGSVDLSKPGDLLRSGNLSRGLISISADPSPSVHIPESEDVGSVDLGSVDLSGCGEWTKTCEKECVDGGGPIPNLVHFIKTDNDFRFYEWVAVLAARKAIKPRKIFVHSVGEIKSCWWNRILPFVEHHIVPSDQWVRSLNGKNVTKLAHKADFMRNAVLYKIGGIYSDTDSIATKSFDDLLHNYQAVISRQVRKWPGNGLVLARKQSCFVCAYAKQACQNFNGDWNSHSIVTLKNLVNEQTKTHRYKNVKILEYRTGFFPFGWNRDELDALYKKDMKTIPFSLLQVYAIHLFHQAAREYLPSLDNYSWLSKSPSPAAGALRAALPSWFNETYHNKNLCIDPP